MPEMIDHTETQRDSSGTPAGTYRDVSGKSPGNQREISGNPAPASRIACNFNMMPQSKRFSSEIAAKPEIKNHQSFAILYSLTAEIHFRRQTANPKRSLHQRELTGMAAGNYRELSGNSHTKNIKYYYFN
jgi:hypothetical protein